MAVTVGVAGEESARTFVPGVPKALFSLPAWDVTEFENFPRRSYAVSADGKRFLVKRPLGRQSGRKIAQMSSDAEDQLARMKLLVQALADTRARAELFTTAMRDDSAQVAVAIAALTKPEHLSK